MYLISSVPCVLVINEYIGGFINTYNRLITTNVIYSIANVPLDPPDGIAWYSICQVLNQIKGS